MRAVVVVVAMAMAIVAMVRIRVLVVALIAVEHQKVHAERIKGRYKHTSQNRKVRKTGSRQMAFIADQVPGMAGHPSPIRPNLYLVNYPS